jgi:hypothetical protein
VQRFRLIEDMKLPFVRVSLDWEAYYEEFKRAHGLHPLLYERLIELRSAPIMVRVTVDGKDVAKQLDMTDMRERLAWLREDADVCDRKLVELEAGKLRTVVDGNVQASDFAAPASAR